MKKILFILLAFISINLNAQTLNDVKETSKVVKETINSISTNTPVVVKSVQKQVKEVAEQTPGILAEVGTAVKDGTNAVVTGAKDATNFVDTSSNFRWMLNKANDFVVSAAQSLKVGAQQVLYIMAKKYFLMGIYAWLQVIGGLILALFLYKKISNYWEKNPDEFFDTPMGTLGLFVLAGLIFWSAYNLQDAINYTFNPEYYVLQELKEFIINVVK